ncbi:nicotinate (nicotinamide) nucleotide adenylyltransferase [Luteolibacter algae]|uniref:Probable nicotinate-nucleotide adenylyltransferase n=1 Tax=Luteolibacter algae TaxID=454151 RepID=A0ABW5DBP1_9BACT
MDNVCYAARFGQYERRKIGVFGGSFDPVHEGHIHLATLAKEAVELDEVWFLPCGVSPHKMETPPSDGALRAHWLRIAIAGLPWAKVSDIELTAEGPSYSYLTLRRLSEKYPANDWYWIMGGDQWTALPRWKNSETIAKLASFIVLARDGVAIDPRPGYRLHTVTGEHPASATAIRAALAAGEKDIPYLDKDVASAIRSKTSY